MVKKEYVSDWVIRAQKIARLGIWDQNPITGELWWSDETFRILGLVPQSTSPSFEKFLQIVHPDDRTIIVEQTELALKSDDYPYNVEYRILLPDKSERFLHEEALIERDKNGKPIKITGIIQDITERKRTETEREKLINQLKTANELLEKQATTDALTGICNRMELNKVLTNEFQRTQRYSTSLSLIIFDIDHFKQVNDTYGHLPGDSVLKILAKLVASNLREIDLFARWGGDEFAILTPETPLDDAIKLAVRLQSKIESHDFSEPEKITTSFGVTTLKKGDNTISLINRADEALYRAKEGGRNQVVYQ